MADGLELDVCRLDPTGHVPASRETAAVVVAAGGREREAVYWIDQREAPPGAPLFVVGADPGRRIAVQIVARGASDYFVLPEDLETLRNALSSAVDRHRARMRTAREPASAKASAFHEIVGESAPLKYVLGRAEKILPHPEATALIVGETGTGKEVLARAIHEGGPRSGAPFIAVNCSALPEGLIESELFGHERGAFTSAHAPKPGLFEVADKGTLFLDEVGTLAPTLQAKLLRVLEDRKVRRVGGTKSRVVDIRILAATNEDLERGVRSGDFRQDLYFRLGVVTLRMPPLRERGEDVLLIARALLRRLSAHHGLPEPPITQEARVALLGHDWPGNVRELKNAVERALLLSPAGTLDVRELVEDPGGGANGIPGSIPFPGTLASMSAAAARATLDLCGGNRSEAARRLGISRQRLRRLLERGPELDT